MKQVLSLKLTGIIHGGKNQINITRTGHRYPNPNFVKWRNETLKQIMAQLPKDFTAIDNINYVWDFIYTAGDNRRRDLPAILDALFHCLERSNVVTDDSLIKNVKFHNMPVDKVNPSCEIICHYD